MWTRIVILSIVGALIGWVTNILAIKLLFRPINTIKIPIIGYEIQGLIPKRRKDVAKSIGQTIERELLSIEEILERVIENQSKSEIIDTIKIKIKDVIIKKVPSFLPRYLKDMVLQYIEDVIDEEGEPAINQMLEKLIHKTTESVNIEEMVEQKINELDLYKLEEMIINIANKELKHIEYLGAVLGLIIGIMQGIIIIFI